MIINQKNEKKTNPKRTKNEKKTEKNESKRTKTSQIPPQKHPCIVRVAFFNGQFTSDYLPLDLIFRSNCETVYVTDKTYWTRLQYRV